MDLSNVKVIDDMWTSGKVTDITVTGDDNAALDTTDKSYTIDTLADDGIVTITYTYTVKASDADGNHQIKNTATATATFENQTVDGKDDATVTVGYTDVSTTKALTSYTRDGVTNDVTDDASFVAQVGDVLNYTVTITNNGNTAATGSVTDTFEVNGEAAELVWGDNVSVSGGVISFENLAANSTITITASYTVKEGDKTITNSVTGGDTRHY